MSLLFFFGLRCGKVDSIFPSTMRVSQLRLPLGTLDTSRRRLLRQRTIVNPASVLSRYAIDTLAISLLVVWAEQIWI